MTLIVAVLCEDGIVVGADGAATLGVPGQMTVRQPVRKLSIIEDRIIIGTSGPVGLGQRLADELASIWKSRELLSKSPEAAMGHLRVKFFNHISVEMQAASMARNVIGSAANASAVSQTILALPIGKRLCLIQFDQQGAPELATTDLPFIAIGSGQPIADPFLAFLRRVLWRHGCKAADPLPQLGDGITGALWTLQHAILTNPGGVSDPIQMVILRKDGGDYSARELADAELAEHKQAIAALEGKIGDEWVRLREPPAAGDAPSVPTPNGK